MRSQSLHPILAKEQDVFQAREMNSAFNFISVAFCLNVCMGVGVRGRVRMCPCWRNLLKSRKG